MKKQFRLYDIYRSASLDKQSNIQGVREYTAEINHFEQILEINHFEQMYVSVTFYNYEMFEDLITIDADAEAKLKEFVKRVNKKLKNCKKPGPKPKK